MIKIKKGHRILIIKNELDKCKMAKKNQACILQLMNLFRKQKFLRGDDTSFAFFLDVLNFSMTRHFCHVIISCRLADWSTESACILYKAFSFGKR